MTFTKMDSGSKYDVSATIVAYKNSEEQLLRTIRSFLYTRLNVRLIVIDNSPTDSLRSWCIESGAEYIFTGRNVGFGAAHNIGINKVIRGADYHLILNPDVYFEIEVLERLHAFMENNPGIGLVMPKVLYPDGSVQYLCKRIPTPFDLFARRFIPFLGPWMRRRMEWYELRDQSYEEIMDVVNLSGCFMFTRSSILQRVGLFDERFFMYLEDLDLARRIRRAARTVYFPEVAIYHEYQKGSYKSVVLLAHHIRSVVAYFNKWGWFFDKERAALNDGPVVPPASQLQWKSGD